MFTLTSSKMKTLFFLVFLLALRPSSAAQGHPQIDVFVPEFDGTDFPKWYKEACKLPGWFSETAVLAVVERLERNALPSFGEDLAILTLDYAPIYRNVDLTKKVFKKLYSCVLEHFVVKPGMGADVPRAIYYLAVLAQAKSALVYYENTSVLSNTEADKGKVMMETYVTSFLNLASEEHPHLIRSKYLISRFDLERNTFQDIEALTLFKDLYKNILDDATRSEEARMVHLINVCIVHILTVHVAKNVNEHGDNDLSYNDVDWHAWLVSLADDHGLMGPERASMILNDLLRVGTPPAIRIGSLYFTENHVNHFLSLLQPNPKVLKFVCKNARLTLLFLKFILKNDEDELLIPFNNSKYYDLPDDFFSQLSKHISQSYRFLAEEDDMVLFAEALSELEKTTISMASLENDLCNLKVTQVLSVEGCMKKVSEKENKTVKNLYFGSKGKDEMQRDRDSEMLMKVQNETTILNSIKVSFKGAFNSDNYLLPEKADPVAISSYLALEVHFNHKQRMNPNLLNFAFSPLDEFDWNILEWIKKTISQKPDVDSIHVYGVFLHSIRRMSLFQLKQFQWQEGPKMLDEYYKDVCKILDCKITSKNPVALVDDFFRTLVSFRDPFRLKEYGISLMETFVKRIPPTSLRCRQTFVVALQRMLSFYGISSTYLKDYERGNADESCMMRFDSQNAEYAVLSVFSTLYSADSWKWENPKGLLDLLGHYCGRGVGIDPQFHRPFVLSIARALSLVIMKNDEALIEQLLGSYWTQFALSMYFLDPSEVEILATSTSPKVALASRIRYTSTNYLPKFQKSEKAGVLKLFNDKGGDVKVDEDNDDEVYRLLSAFLHIFIYNLAGIINSPHTFKRESNPIRSKLSTLFNLRTGSASTSPLQLSPLTTRLQQLRINFFKKMDARLELVLTICMELFVLQLKDEKSSGPYDLSCIHRIDDNTVEFISPRPIQTKTGKSRGKPNTQTIEEVKPSGPSIEDLLREINGSDETNSSSKQKGKKGPPVQSIKAQGKEKASNSSTTKVKSSGDSQANITTNNAPKLPAPKVPAISPKTNNASAKTPDDKKSADDKSEKTKMKLTGKEPDEKDEELIEQKPPKMMKDSSASEQKTQPPTDSIAKSFIFLPDGTAEPKFDRDNMSRKLIFERIFSGKPLPFLLSPRFYTGLTTDDPNELYNSIFRSWNISHLSKSRLELWAPERFVFRVNSFCTSKYSKKHIEVINVLKSIHKEEPELIARLWSLCKYSSKEQTIEELEIDIKADSDKPVAVKHGKLFVSPDLKSSDAVKQHLIAYLNPVEARKPAIKDKEVAVKQHSLGSSPSNLIPSKVISEKSKEKLAAVNDLCNEPTSKALSKQLSSERPKDDPWGKGKNVGSMNGNSKKEFPPLSSNALPTTTTTNIKPISVTTATNTKPISVTTATSTKSNSATTTTTNSATTTASTKPITTTTSTRATTETTKIENPSRPLATKNSKIIRKDDSSPESIHSSDSSPTTQTSSPASHSSSPTTLSSTTILSTYKVIDIEVPQSVQEQRKKGIYSSIIPVIDFLGLLKIDAEFLAFDFELTGLGEGTNLSFSDLDAKISGIQAHSIVQIGLMPMRKVSDANGNIHVEQAGPLYRIPVTALADPRKVKWQEKSKKFLIDNGFSMEEWQLKAIPSEALQTVWNLMKTKTLIVHNGLTDLMHLLQALKIPIPLSCKDFPDLIRIFTLNKMRFYDSRVLMMRKFPYRPEGLEVLSKDFLSLPYEEKRFHDAAFDAFCTGMLVQKYGPLFASELNLLFEMRDREEKAVSSTSEGSKERPTTIQSSSPQSQMSVLSPPFSPSTLTHSGSTPTINWPVHSSSSNSQPPAPTNHNNNDHTRKS